MDRIIDFDALVEEGTIRIPDEMQEAVKNGNRVHVTIDTHSPLQRREKRTVKRMRENPLHVPGGFKPMTRDELYDRGV